MPKLKRLGPTVVLSVVLSAVITLFAGAAAQATPPKDAVVTPLARGSMGQLEAQHDGLELKRANGNADVALAKVTIEPGGSTGWHHHPGLTLVSVASGSVTEYHEDCGKSVLKAGEGFSEGTDEAHTVRNTGNVDAVLYATFIVPSSTTAEGLRIDDPQPENCDPMAATGGDRSSLAATGGASLAAPVALAVALAVAGGSAIGALTLGRLSA
jgi:quercetin dioxygenase-like cupin family protein